MKKKLGAVILSGALVVAMAMPVTALAGQGKGKGGGKALQNQTRSAEQNRFQHRLRSGSSQDSSLRQSGAMEKKGNAYGPGDGTGNKGDRPQDGTGYGAPWNR
jgi:hypothetical protein